MLVNQVMTSAPVTVSPRASLAQALRLLRELDIRHLPVVDDGALVGILSDRDLRGQLGPVVPPLASTPLASEIGPESSVAAVMSVDLLAVTPETELGEAIDLMLEHRVGALPVTATDSDELVGIVSYVDILRVLRDLV